MSFEASFNCRHLSMHPQGKPSADLESPAVPVEFKGKIDETVIIPRMEGRCRAAQNNLCALGCTAVSIVNVISLDPRTLREKARQGYVIGTIAPNSPPRQ